MSKLNVKSSENNDESITIYEGYQPPFLWQDILDFFSTRIIPGVEQVANETYMRTVRIEEDSIIYTGWIKVNNAPEKNALMLTISPSLSPCLPKVLTRIRDLFDLRSDPHVIYESLSLLDNVKSGIRVLGTRLPGCFDSFEMIVRAVLGQQISVKAATTLAKRLTESHGTPLQTGIDGLTHLFPTTKDILALGENIDEILGPLGITNRRSKTILELAKVLESGSIDFNFYTDPESEIDKLLEIPGIGMWTAHYIAMRAMGWQDAFPHTDLGIKKALAPRSEKEILKLAEKWRPWRAYATIWLWNSL